MSSGEQLNATFSEYWLQQKHQGGSGLVSFSDKEILSLESIELISESITIENTGDPNLLLSSYILFQRALGKHCMTMQAASNKRTIFSPEDCGRPLTFICEQLRCLYYNYPVTPFPDPDAEAEIAALRADLDGSHSSPSESR